MVKILRFHQRRTTYTKRLSRGKTGFDDGMPQYFPRPFHNKTTPTQVYEGELEDAFDNFTDLAQTFNLYRGKGGRDPDDPEGQCVGKFKGSIKVYPLPDDGTPEPERIFSNIPPSAPVEVVVRVYVIKVSYTRV